MKAQWKKSFSRIARIGEDPADDDDIQLQKSLLVVCAIPFMAAGIAWGLMYIAFSQPLAGAIPITYSIISLFSLIHFSWTHHYHFFRFSQLTLILLLPFFLMMALGGFITGSAVILWALTCPLGALLFDKPGQAPRWFMAFIGLVIISGILQPYLQAANTFSADLVTFFFAINFIGVGSIVFMMVFYFVAQKNIFQERSETLLLNILPKEIANILKRDSHTIANQHDEASVLFADMVNFTPLTAELAPVQMVELLNEAFSYFDSLLDRYGVEKIRTIGDNFMVASGIPGSRPDHAQALVSMALDMREYIARHSFLKGQHVNFRFGINSGPVIAGVIGSRKFVYDVWGDTVNVASRMESQGKGGSIQITRATYELIKNEFICEPRGVVNVKGKGKMKVWFVIEQKPHAAT